MLEDVIRTVSFSTVCAGLGQVITLPSTELAVTLRRRRYIAQWAHTHMEGAE